MSRFNLMFKKELEYSFHLLTQKKAGASPVWFLCVLMALFVLASNYLVQFPLMYQVHFGVHSLNLQDYITYGAFPYPLTFIFNDVTNYTYGAKTARRVVILGFVLGVLSNLVLTYFFPENLSYRIIAASGCAFLFGQLLDVSLFTSLKSLTWYTRPFFTSVAASGLDSCIFFFIAFYATGLPWFTMGLGDYSVKIIVAVLAIVPFRILIAGLLNQKRVQL